MREAVAHSLWSSYVVGLGTARRAARSALLWGVLFGFLIANEILTYRTTFPTVASRRQFAATFGSNHALAAIVGPGHRLDTVEGVVAWRVFGLMIMVGAIWGLLTATRLLRGEEDAGRWELLLAGRTSRRNASVQALVGLAVGWVLLWTLAAVATVAAARQAGVAFPLSASVHYATATTASAALFLAVGALTSQLAGTRRQANGLAAAVFGLCYLARLVADAGTGMTWLRWASPLGWIENSRPLTGSDPWPLALVTILTGGLAAIAIVLAGRRDAGVGALDRQRASGAAMTATKGLDGPMGLAWRLERWVVISWVAGIGILALVFGAVARAAADADFASNVDETIGRLGGRGGGAQAWIGYLFLYLAAVLAFAAAAQVAALRAEEAAGHLDHLLARSVARRVWLVGRIAIGALLVIGSSLVAALGGWVGVHDERIGLDAMLRAGLNLAVPGLFILGFGVLLYGLAPRWAALALYVTVLWTFLVEVFGTSITTNRWLLDTALLTHLGPVPASPLQWHNLLAICAIAVVSAGLGLVAFERRDLSAG